MGMYEGVNCIIKGQIKPYEEGRIFWAELELLCAKYGLDIDKFSERQELVIKNEEDEDNG